MYAYVCMRVCMFNLCHKGAITCATFDLHSQTPITGGNVCMCVYVYVHVCVCIYACMHSHTPISRGYACVCMYVCVYIYMHIILS